MQYIAEPARRKENISVSKYKSWELQTLAAVMAVNF